MDIGKTGKEIAGSRHSNCLQPCMHAGSQNVHQTNIQHQNTTASMPPASGTETQEQDNPFWVLIRTTHCKWLPVLEL